MSDLRATRRRVRLVLGALLIFAGCAILSADSLDWDLVLVSVADGRGIDLSDVVGWATVAGGVAMLANAAARR